MMGLHSSDIIVYEVYNSRIHRIYDDLHQVSDIIPSDIVYAQRISALPGTSLANSIALPVLQRKFGVGYSAELDRIDLNRPMVFGDPFFVTTTVSTTVSDLKKSINSILESLYDSPKFNYTLSILRGEDFTPVTGTVLLLRKGDNIVIDWDISHITYTNNNLQERVSTDTIPTKLIFSPRWKTVMMKTNLTGTLR